MAFDMYLESRREAIEDHEEVIFDLIDDESKYPNLIKIRNEIYGSLEVNPEMANYLSHELLALSELANKDTQTSYQAPIIYRLATFFSAGYRSKIIINCTGD